MKSSDIGRRRSIGGGGKGRKEQEKQKWSRKITSYDRGWCWHYFLDVAGNSLVLYLFTKTKALRTPANNFVVNLAFSDLCMMLSQFPMFTFNCFNGGVWCFGPLACQLYAALGSVFGLSSICTMAAIAYDRYNVIVKGIKRTPITTGDSISLPSLLACNPDWLILLWFPFEWYQDQWIESLVQYLSYDLVMWSLMNELFIDVLDGREIGVLDRVLLDVRYRMEFASLLRMGQIHSGRHPRFLLFRLSNTRFFSTFLLSILSINCESLNGSTIKAIITQTKPVKSN